MTTHGRRWRLTLLASTLVIAAACGSDARMTEPGSSEPPPPKVLLRDVLAEPLPSPYYHFEYDADGTITRVAVASGLFDYDVRYANGRIDELRNETPGNRDRVVYAHDALGRISGVQYVDANGSAFGSVSYIYDGVRLTGVVRRKRIGGSFVVDKTTVLTYDDDGNVSELAERWPAIAGVQLETNGVQRFEDYDTGINVDDFGLLHDEFFDHLVLLPGVRLQKGNPRRATRTGDGITFSVDYTYDYDEAKRPVAKHGDLTITSGTDAGRHFQIATTFTYY
jgi:hypothetical protein